MFENKPRVLSVCDEHKECTICEGLELGPNPLFQLDGIEKFSLLDRLRGGSHTQKTAPLTTFEGGGCVDGLV